MTIDEVIQHVCGTVGLAYHSIGDYSKSCDGFCQDCLMKNRGLSFCSDSGTLDFVRKAVAEKLVRDGFKIDPYNDVPSVSKEFK